MAAPIIKVLIEGVQVPARSVTRIQVEGEPTQAIINLWPTNAGTKIRRGSSVAIFRWEDDARVLAYHDQKYFDPSVHNGVWELFFDGYIDRKPTVSRRENRALVIYCAQYIKRLSSVYLRATTLSTLDIGVLRDKAFMGINPNPQTWFVSTSDAALNAMARLKNMLSQEGVAEGLVKVVKDAVNYDELYARVASVMKLWKRFVAVKNDAIKEFLGTENLLNVITSQVDQMASTTNLIQLINQLMYQSLYTAIMIPSPKYSIARNELPPDSRPSVDDSLFQYIYKPQLFFAVPIKSNLIFPIAIDSMEPIQSRIDQPTRIAVVGRNRVLGRNQAMVFINKLYYPPEIGKNLTIDMNAADYPDFEDRYTEEEYIEERLVPRVVGMPFPESLMQYGNAGQYEGSLGRMYGNYIFHLEKNTSEPIQIQTAFDPYLICGLSGAIFDEQFGYILGRFRTIQDMINIDSNIARTVVEVVNVRLISADTINDDEIQIENYDSLFNGDTPFFDSDFDDYNIGDTFYKKYFGSDSINNLDDAYFENGPSDAEPIAGSLAGIFKQYQNVSGESAEKFMRGIKYRPVVTEGEYTGFIGAKKEDGSYVGRYGSCNRYKAQYNYKDVPLSGDDEDNPQLLNPFMEERQRLVIDYVRDIRDAHLAKIA